MPRSWATPRTAGPQEFFDAFRSLGTGTGRGAPSCPNFLSKYGRGVQRALVGLRVLVRRVALEDRWVDRVEHGRALVRDLRGEHREVGTGRRPALSTHARQVVGVEHEDRRGAHDREVLRARLDDGVARLVRVEGRSRRCRPRSCRRRARRSPLVHPLGPRVDRFDRALEQARRQRTAGVGDHADAESRSGVTPMSSRSAPPWRHRSRCAARSRAGEGSCHQ